MAAPHVAGVAALMAAVAPDLPAAELRALLLQHAVRRSRRSARAYVDALASVLAASTAELRRSASRRRCACSSATRAGPRDRARRSRCSAPRRAWPASSSSSTAAGSRRCAAAAACSPCACAAAPAAGWASRRSPPTAARSRRASARVRTLRAGKRSVGPAAAWGERYGRRRCALAAALAVLAAPSAGARGARRARSRSAARARLRPLVADLAYFYRRETRARRGSRSSAAAPGRDRRRRARDRRRRPVQPRARRRRPARLVFTPIALSAMCLVTNPANPVPNLTRAQLQDLVAGPSRLDPGPGLPARDASSPWLRPHLRRPRRLPVGLRRPRDAARLRPRTFTTAAQMRDFMPHTDGLGLRRPRVTPGAAHRPVRGRAVHGERAPIRHAARSAS